MTNETFNYRLKEKSWVSKRIQEAIEDVVALYDDYGTHTEKIELESIKENIVHSLQNIKNEFNKVSVIDINEIIDKCCKSDVLKKTIKGIAKPLFIKNSQKVRFKMYDLHKDLTKTEITVYVNNGDVDYLETDEGKETIQQAIVNTYGKYFYRLGLKKVDMNSIRVYRKGQEKEEEAQKLRERVLGLMEKKTATLEDLFEGVHEGQIGRLCSLLDFKCSVESKDVILERIRLFGFEDKFREALEVRYRDGKWLNDYYEEAKVKLIDFLKQNETIELLKNVDMNQFVLDGVFRQKPTTPIYKQTMIGHTLLSIDLRKANFSAITAFSKMNGTEFSEDYDWNKFMSKFTNHKEVYGLKHMRQVAFGNVVHNRQETIEKWLICERVKEVINTGLLSTDSIISLNKDEIVFDLGKAGEIDAVKLFDAIMEQYKATEKSDKPNKTYKIPLKMSLLNMYRLVGTDGYLKEITREYETDTDNLDTSVKHEIKATSGVELVACMRYMKGEEPKETDTWFMDKNRIAKLVYPINIQLVKTEEEYEQIIGRDQFKKL